MNNCICFTLSLLLLSFGHVSAEVLVSDSFEGAGTSSLNGYTPDTGATWVAYSPGVDQGWKVSGGNAYMGSASINNGMGGVELGANYFSNNPNVYTLEATLTISSTDTNWYGIGFSQTAVTGSSGYYAGGGTEGRPWIFLRGNGEANVRAGGATGTNLSKVTGNSTTNATLKLVLDTSVANWTVDGYINGTQMDLNGGSAGMTFAYSSNPSNIGNVGMSASANVVGQVHDFTLSVIPEPSTFLLFSLGLFLLVCRGKR
ncbi:PEP-CTERM sorting domain-containing protein [Kiritimatiellaeota bacterium B1221]|nr:PEP-CTERM sorting domain-containing protein [Kiritimatiellaeota bacterium B1221]